MDKPKILVNSAQVREYLAGLEAANRFEVEELRNTPVEIKMCQIWSMMKSAHRIGDDVQRELGVRQVQARWARLYGVLGG